MASNGGLDLATLGLRVDFRQVTEATKAVDELAASGGSAETSVESLGRGARRAANEAKKALPEVTKAVEGVERASARASAQAVRMGGSVRSSITDAGRAAVEANLQIQAVAQRLERELIESSSHIKQAVAQGFLTPQEAEVEGRRAAEHYNRGLADAMQSARAAGAFRVGGAQLSGGETVVEGGELLADLTGRFKDVDAAGRRAGLGIGRLNSALLSTVASVTGTNTVMARLLGTVGTFAVGTSWMLGVLAGLGALAVAWDRITKNSREARKAQADAIKELQESAAQRALGPVGREGFNLAEARRREAELQAELQAAGRQYGVSARDVLAGVPTVTRAPAAIRAELEELQVAIREGELLVRERVSELQDGINEERRRAEEEAQRLHEARLREEQRRAEELAQAIARSAAVVADLDLQVDAEQRRHEAQLQGGDALEAVNRELEREQALRSALADAVPEDVQAIEERVNLLYDLREANDDLARSLAERAAAEEAARRAQAREQEEMRREQEEMRREIDRSTQATASFERQAVAALTNVAHAFGDVGRAVGGMLGSLLDAQISFSAAMDGISQKVQAGLMSSEEAATAQDQARATRSAAVGGAAMGGAVGFIGVAVSSVLSSRGERARKIEAARQEWERALDNYVDELADASRWEQMRGEVTVQTRALINSALDAILAPLDVLDRTASRDVADSFRAQFDLDSEEGVREGLEKLAGMGVDGAAAALAEFVRKMERIDEAIAEAVGQQEDEIAVRMLVAQGRDEEAEALRRQHEETLKLAEAAELGGDALVELWQELFAVEAAAREAAKAEAERRKEVERLRDSRAMTLDVTEREAMLRGDDRGALEARLQAQAEAELNALADRLAAGEIEIELYNRLVAVITGEVTAALEAFDEAAKRAAQSAMDDLQMRLLVAHGMDEEAFRLRQKLELQRAINDGMDEEYIAMLRQVHAAEALALARSQAERADRQHQSAVEATTRAIEGASRALNAPSGFTFALSRNRILRELGPNREGGPVGAAAGGGGVSIGTINIQTQPGQDTQAIGQQVVKQIGREIGRSIRAGGFNSISNLFEG